MQTLRLRHDSTLCRVITGLLAFGFAANVFANPTGMTVGSGTATAQQSGSQLTVTASQNAILNWNTFNIAAGEKTTFVQPSSTSIVWNRINDPNPSQIFGTIQANGVVVLLNSSGFYFGPNSFVSAAGLVVSTANCAPPENGGGTWEFNGPPPLASIINYGHITVGSGGSAFLIADKVENHGTIEAPGGSIGLADGQTVLLSERPDGRGMSLQVTLPQGSVDNVGNLIADAGTIALNAKVVNQSGIIQANSVQNNNGIIELVASDSLKLGASSKIFANGDNSASGSDGGQIMLQTPQTFSDILGSQIQFRGGANGGNGGRVLIYASQASVRSQLDGTAKTGFTAGSKFYYSRADTSDLTLTASSLAPFAGFSSILFQRSGNIILDAASTLDLGVGTGQLTLEANGDITFKSTSTSSAKIFDASSWSVALDAGYNFANNAVMFGAGNIFLNGGSGLTGGGLIQTFSGNISLTASQSITVGKGYVNTTGGGSITAQALKGNINAGSFAQGYAFQSASTPSQGYYVDFSKGLGGISTAAGGDVSLTAGGNVSSFLPINSTATAGATAGSGAYGAQVGNVTIVAGGNVTGQYLVANGIGSIYAGVLMDASGNPIKDLSGNYSLGTTGSAGSNPSAPNLALSLIKGGWNVTAALNIVLQEVRNPNGVFNSFAGVKHTFNYAPDAFVNLTARNMVQLGGSKGALPRSSDQPVMPVIYAPILNISAGQGGVHFYGDSTFSQLILFPSPEGSLTINTTQGGSLVSDLASLNNTPQIFSLIVSDSGKTQYTSSGDFGLNDHALTPVHLDNPTPITLNISGDMSLVLIGAPEAAQINVGGSMKNSRFQGMNLAAGDTTSINVTGQILNRSAFTTVDLNQYPGTAAPDLSKLAQAVSSDPTAAQLVTSFYYDSATGLFTYQNITGKSLSSVLTLLQHLAIQTGIDANGDPTTSYVSVINQATAAALQTQYNLDNVASGLPAGVGPPSSAAGIIIGGGGKFDITAQSIDLGTSAGIQSKGAGLYRIGGSFPLANLFDKGSDIFVTTTGHPTIDDPTTGDLNMFSSSIASLNGGLITVNAGGDVNLGSSQFTPNSDSARGIYSTSGSDVAVYANKDINLNGSRIAAFDGGNVTVESFNGDLNAGIGGLGGVLLTAFYVDPITHSVYSASPEAFGSGIIAETFGSRDSSYPAPVAALGNILIETPNGNVNANSAGILQLAFNHVDYPNAMVEVLAGYELRDGGGNPLTAGGIANGTPVLVSDNRNVDASNSGVIAQNAILKATGDVKGAIFAKGNIDVTAVNNVNVTALAQGTANVSAGGTLSGTIIGIGGITATGGSVDAALLSNAGISGSTSGQTGFAQGTAANATAQADQSQEAAKAADADTGDDTDEQNKKKKPIALAQKVSRVTVLLPNKNN